MAGGYLFPWSPAWPLMANLKTGQRIARIGRDESGDRRSMRTRTERPISTTGAPRRRRGDWFYRSAKCDVHARRRRYINNVNYIPPAWVTVFCALSPLLVLFSAYKSNYLATYLSEGTENKRRIFFWTATKIKSMDIIERLKNLVFVMILRMTRQVYSEEILLCSKWRIQKRQRR